MGQPVSDAAVEFLGACRHSLRFSFGAPIGYPYAAAQLARGNPPPVLFRRLQAAEPPPRRGGARWQSGLMIGDEPFEPEKAPDRLRDVWAQEGAVALDVPEPETVVLDWWFSVPRARQMMTFPGPDQDRCILSVPYWNPSQSYGEPVTTQVEYFVTHRLAWAQRPRDKWVAVSFDAFWPPERDSADVIVRLDGCDALCPHSD
jgi:hypothetical protein